jgi:hypothetical protein
MDIVCEEGRVFGSRYYTAKPILDYWLGPPLSPWGEMMEWCVETFGPTPVDGIWTPDACWYANNAKFWFRRKKDLEWFLLRWQ